MSYSNPATDDGPQEPAATLELDEHHARWLRRLMEQRVSDAQVNTEPEASHIVNDLNAQGM
jgi:hypothetical protein